MYHILHNYLFYNRMMIISFICLHRAYLSIPPLLFKDRNNIIIMHSLVHNQSVHYQIPGSKIYLNMLGTLQVTLMNDR